ncbi:hypothetical protein ACNGTP_03610 [Bisgaard Taxon 45]
MGILIENSQHDTVGSSLFVGNNPYTINTNLKNKGAGVLLWDIAFGESSSHNCYGLGQKQCGKDGYRYEKKLLCNQKRQFLNSTKM